MLSFRQLGYKGLKVLPPLPGSAQKQSAPVEVKCVIMHTMIFEPELIKHLLGAKIPITVFADRSRFVKEPLVERMDQFNCNVVYQPKFGQLDYGVFHSKLQLLEFDDRLRVVVSSANLYIHDWDHMSQVIWL